MNYRSKLSFFGLPLVHAATGAMVDGKYRRGKALGWIAVGDMACGFIALGGLAVGVIALGGLSMGGLTLGGLALGFWAIGGGAIGVYAAGGGAIAVTAALGGFAWSLNFALGGAAFGPHANDAAAVEFFRKDLFFDLSQKLIHYSRWVMLLWIIPIIIAIKRRGKNDSH